MKTTSQQMMKAALALLVLLLLWAKQQLMKQESIPKQIWLQSLSRRCESMENCVVLLAITINPPQHHPTTPLCSIEMSILISSTKPGDVTVVTIVTYLISGNKFCSF